MKEYPEEYMGNGKYIVDDEGYGNEGIVIDGYCKKHMRREK